MGPSAAAMTLPETQETKCKPSRIHRVTKAHFVPHSRAQMSPAAALRQTQTQRTALLAFLQARRSRPQDANPLRAPLTTSQQEAPYPHHYGSVPPPFHSWSQIPWLPPITVLPQRSPPHYWLSPASITSLLLKCSCLLVLYPKPRLPRPPQLGRRASRREAAFESAAPAS